MRERRQLTANGLFRLTIYTLTLLWSLSGATPSLAGSGNAYPYGGGGLLVPRTSFGGAFDDTILLTRSNLLVDVPSVSVSPGLGVFWAAHQLPNSGLGSGAEIGLFWGPTSAPGALAPSGGYDASYWNLYLDVIPSFWLPMASREDSPFGLSLEGRLGIGYQSLTIDDSGVDATGLLDAGYGGFRLRYGGGVRARLGGKASKPLLLSVAWVRNHGSYGDVHAGNTTVEFQDDLDGHTTDILVTIGYMFSRPDEPRVNEQR